MLNSHALVHPNQADLGKLILRITLAGLILFHGIHKLMHPQSLQFIASTLIKHGLPSFIAYGVYIGEVIAPLAILIGFKTRINALIIVINMLFVFGLVHMSELFSVTSSGGLAVELQLFYLLTSLAVVLLGSGKFAAKPD
ncbi:MAG: DoxX family protein [Parashewanella sp.]